MNIEKVDHIVNFLIGIATGGDYRNANIEYRQIRTDLLKEVNPDIKNRIPACIKSSFDSTSFFRYMQAFGGYQDRRVQIAKELMPLSDFVNGVERTTKLSTDEITAKFNNDHISSQIELMLASQKDNPTEAIGKAKELIESCCKTILERLSITAQKSWDINDLINATIKELELSPSYIKDTAQLSETIKQVLGNLRAISTGVATLRNAYGSGHGKSANYKGLEERHAKLAIGSAVTLVNFLWDSFELQQEKKAVLS